MSAKRAFITGITGQDGGYLAKLLLEKGYEVYGAFRRTSSVNLSRLKELGIEEQVRLEPFDLLEFSNVLRCIERIQPDEVYNLAAQSFVGISFEQPIFTGDVNGLGTARLLEAIRVVGKGQMRFYQASTSEMFGMVQETPQRETTPFYPRSPYGVAKLYAHWMTINYREAYGMHASCGILFNHESPLRGREFVTRKITSGLAELLSGQRDVIELGNIDAIRDWGYAGDYVLGMWEMVQQPEASDYVLATGKTHSVREFCEMAGAVCGLAVEWESLDGDKIGRDRLSGRVIFRTTQSLERPAEVDVLCGDASKARKNLGWRAGTSLEALVSMMVESDMALLGSPREGLSGGSIT